MSGPGAARGAPGGPSGGPGPDVGLVVVGGSWGGYEALCALLAGLPRPLPVPLVAVLHRPPRRGGGPDLAAVLTRRTGRPVVEPDDKAPLVAGRVHVAPEDYHLLVEGAGVALSTEPAVHHCRPAVDVTLESAAQRYGPGLVGVVLTGANRDGAAGVRRVRERGGRTMAQDPATAVRPEMPAAAVATGDVDVTADPAGLASRLAAWLPAVVAS
jgi:two-component system, chemotaxis family, protein-glutamate methylesterase/glutaminase